VWGGGGASGPARTKRRIKHAARTMRNTHASSVYAPTAVGIASVGNRMLSDTPSRREAVTRQRNKEKGQNPGEPAAQRKGRRATGYYLGLGAHHYMGYIGPNAPVLGG
jgi:hypothetical protein